MAPKKAPAKGKKATKKDDDSGLSKTDSANLINQLKSAKHRLHTKTSVNEVEDKNKVEVLAKYSSLSLRDPMKKEILAKWIKDKSCSWWGVWAQAEFKTSSSSSEQFEGWGTKYQP